MGSNYGHFSQHGQRQRPKVPDKERVTRKAASDGLQPPEENEAEQKGTAIQRLSTREQARLAARLDR